MKHIKNIGKLYLLDWKRIFKNPISAFLVVALIVLPSLYAWFNIKALWDPYGNTEELPVAIYSDDAGASFQDTDVKIGDEVIDTLHDNHQLGWKFVKSEKALTEGVKSGKYYAGIYIPKDFSKDLMSFTSGEIKKPKLDYYFNEKINAIAPKITDKGANSLQEEIAENFIQTASETMVKAFNEVGYNIETNLVSINKVKSMILDVDENADKIDGYTQKVLDLQKKFPEIKDKIAKADAFMDYLPEVDQLGAKIVELNDKMPEIEKQAKIILTLQDKLPEIKNAGKQLAMVDDDFDNISATLTDGINEAKQGLDVIQQVQNLLPKIDQLGQDASTFTDETLKAAKKLDENLDSITTVVQTNLQMIIGLSESLNTFAGQMNDILNQTDELTPEQRESLKKVLQGVSDSLGKEQTIINDMIDWLTQLQEQLGGDFSDTIARLATVRDAAGALQKATDQLIAGVDTFSKADIQQFLHQLEDFSQSLVNLGQAIDVDAVSQKAHDLLEKQLIPALSNAQDLLAETQKIDFNALLSSTSKTIRNAVSMLEEYQKEMPAIGQEIHDANVLLNGHMDEIVQGINKGAALYTNDLPELKKKLSKASDFMQNDWPSVKKDLTSTMGLVNDKLPDVEKAINEAADLVNEDWPSLRAGAHKAAEAIRKGEKVADLDDIIRLLKSDAMAESDFFAKPVDIKTTTMYPIANNGSASTPFYTALCLWVGALLLSSVAVVKYHLDEKDKKRYSKRETFVARMLTFLTMGVGQVIIVTLGNIFALGVDVKQPVYSVIFALLVGLTFMMIIYILVGLFGNVGKGIGIVILVLSISGGGGNYPIQVSGKFFQFINPFLPFTYAVNLLRESAGGIYWPNAWHNIIVLAAIFVIVAAIGIYVSPLMTKPMEKIEKMTSESHFFH